MKKLYLLILLSVFPVFSFAHDVEINRFNFNLLTKAIDAEMAKYGNRISSSVVFGGNIKNLLNFWDNLRLTNFDSESGTKDLTSLGTNMSFEDLSAQGGNQTTSVEDVPVGWSMFINGMQVRKANDILKYIFNWCGVNSDAEGEGLDGSMVFGIWTSSVPNFELSQKLSGLETGTYIVSAGLMAGANDSGSRLTTQRIFGNLNSTYYGAKSMYNEEALDQNEVFSFAGNPEITTNRELRKVSVRAYVYDGTLTF